MLSGEYALNLLEGAALSRARQLEAQDPDFRREVAFWHEGFAALADADPVVPPARVRRGIEARLFDQHPASWLDRLFLPENRLALVAVGLAKVALIAALLWVLAGR